MAYPLWLRIAVQDGEILYPEIVQKRYENSLLKRYKNNINISLLLRDVLIIPEQYRQGNYFCDLYYNNESSECVFTQYEIPVRKKMDFVYCWDFKLRMDHKMVEKLKNTFPNEDELILFSGHMGLRFIFNGLQTNILFWDKTFWYSYEKPYFMTAELEKLVQEKKVRLLDTCGIGDSTKVMFVNEFEPFDLNRALPIENLIGGNHNDQNASFRWKILIPLLIFVLLTCFVVQTPFEYSDYVTELYNFLYYPTIIFSVLFSIFLLKIMPVKIFIAGHVMKALWHAIFMWIIVIVLGTFLILNVALPYGGKAYTLLKPSVYHEVTVRESIKSNKYHSTYKLNEGDCNYIIQLNDHIEDKNYYVCSAKDKNELIKRYRVEVLESDFGYHIKDIQQINY